VRSGGAASFHDRVRTHATSLALPLPGHVDRLLQVIELVTAQLRGADAELERFAKNDVTCKALMSVPGVGPVTAVRFRAAIDDIARFSSAHGLQSYLGLTPGENSSSDRQHRTAITKAGASSVRRLLVQAAWAAIRRAPSEPMVQWALRIAERRGKFIAVVALARKLAGILFALWRDGTTYRSQLSATT
jgi:transposase